MFKTCVSQSCQQGAGHNDPIISDNALVLVPCDFPCAYDSLFFMTVFSGCTFKYNVNYIYYVLSSSVSDATAKKKLVLVSVFVVVFPFFLSVFFFGMLQLNLLVWFFLNLNTVVSGL